MSNFVEFKRDGKSVWPYCADCGCRLQIERAESGWSHECSLTHFGISPEKDARGCICPSLFKIKIVGADKVAEFV